MSNAGIVFSVLQLPQPERIAMKHAFALVALASALLVPAHAAVVHTSSAAFLSQVAGGAYTETFDTALADAPRALDFAQGDYAYTAFAGRGLYGDGNFLSTSTTPSSLTISFTGAAVTAFGANFYNTGIDLASARPRSSSRSATERSRASHPARSRTAIAASPRTSPLPPSPSAAWAGRISPASTT